MSEIAFGVAAGLLLADALRWALRRYWRAITRSYGRGYPPPWRERTPLTWRHAWFMQRRVLRPLGVWR